MQKGYRRITDDLLLRLRWLLYSKPDYLGGAICGWIPYNLVYGQRSQTLRAIGPAAGSEVDQVWCRPRCGLHGDRGVDKYEYGYKRTDHTDAEGSYSTVQERQCPHMGDTFKAGTRAD